MQQFTLWLPLLTTGAYINGLESHLDWQMHELSSRDFWKTHCLIGMCFTYLDDTLVFSDKFDDQLIHLKNVFQRMAEKGIAVKVLIKIKDKFFNIKSTIMQGLLARKDTKLIRQISKQLQIEWRVGEIKWLLGRLVYCRRYTKSFTKTSASKPLNQVPKPSNSLRKQRSVTVKIINTY